MSNIKYIKTALLSVSDKNGLTELAQYLAARGVTLLSTGGTAKVLREAGLSVTDVSEVTGFPEIMDGRVKTLHPAIHGGILARRNDATHVQAMQEHNISAIDLVVLNLYPFEQTVARGADYDETVENIDIGGPAMLRAAAKNHEEVTIITQPDDYAGLLEQIEANNGGTERKFRQQMAAQAYARTAAYDAAIARWFAKQLNTDFPERYTSSYELVSPLRYGENPHQQAAVYAAGNQQGTLVGAQQLQGKELSYNNLNDTDAAWQLVQEFTEPSIAIIKHANPCGVASAPSLAEAYENAFACDPKSAFGGIIAANGPIDEKSAQQIAKQFAEVVIAPEISEAARAVFAQKKNLRVLETGGLQEKDRQTFQLKTISGGLLVQSEDTSLFNEADLKIVTKRQPSEQEQADLRFAFAVCKHVKSNAIVMAKDGRTHAMGAGQMSRVDSVHIACRKAEENGLGTAGTVLASDAFFPFDDNVHAAAAAGVTALIQPGGSVRDEEVIAAANAHGMAMLFTGQRHFKH
jgi:phosphoribosylaminoimidazolecarboxamide formyltransferase/IMP cyclohydrolase